MRTIFQLPISRIADKRKLPSRCSIRELYQRLKDGKYQAQPLRRIYIPKENGKQRPISIPALEESTKVSFS